jgi:hypothetical protein
MQCDAMQCNAAADGVLYMTYGGYLVAVNGSSGALVWFMEVMYHLRDRGIGIPFMMTRRLQITQLPAGICSNPPLLLADSVFLLQVRHTTSNAYSESTSSSFTAVRGEQADGGAVSFSQPVSSAQPHSSCESQPLTFRICQRPRSRLCPSSLGRRKLGSRVRMYRAVCRHVRRGPCLAAPPEASSFNRRPRACCNWWQVCGASGSGEAARCRVRGTPPS